MEAKPFMQVVAIESIPELNKKFREWYEVENLPCLFEDPNLSAVCHYQIIKGLSDPTHPGLAEPKGGYAKYLTIYGFESEASYRAFENGLEMKKVLANAIKTWKNGEIIIKFQAQYRLRGTWLGQKKAKVGLIHITGVEIPDEADEAFSRYYDGNIIPTVIKNPNLLGADSYQLVEGINHSVSPFIIEHKGKYPKYYNIYKLEGPEAFRVYEHSAEMITNNKNFAKFAEAWPPSTFKVVIRAQYVPIKTWVK